jgi:Rrf2 family protein
VIYLSINASEDKPQGIKEVADELDITRHFLAKIMQLLAKQNLVSSKKGRNGGFYLSEDNKKKKLAEIIRSIDGQEVLTGCVLGFEQCDSKNPCVFHDNVVKFRDNLNEFLVRQDLGNVAQVVEENNFKI